ncbi:MAG: radical SAM protein [Victivallaceae bacterium]
MAFFKITYNAKYSFATLHNFGCTFKCPFCSYKLRSGADGTPGLSWPKPERFLSTAEMQQALRSVSPEKVYFMGGEPTVAKELEEMLRFAKQELNAVTKLGHTNGSKLPLPCLDGANVGFKAWNEELHRQITGQEKSLIYDNFKAAFDAGLQMAANMVFVPGLVDIDQLEALAAWLGELSPEIPLHIMGYIPVPGLNYRRPEQEEIAIAEECCRKHLRRVASSSLSSEEAMDLSSRDDRFDVIRIA